jgi:CIC family chloride channel protein
MIATVLASVITQQVYVRSFFIWQLERRGVVISGGQEHRIMQDLRIAQTVDEDFDHILPETRLPELRKKLKEAKWGSLYVRDEEGLLKGTVTFSDLGDHAFDTSEDQELSVMSLARPSPSVLALDDDLDAALELHLREKEPHLPIVDSRDSMRLVGISHEYVILAAYQKALSEARAEERGET